VAPLRATLAAAALMLAGLSPFAVRAADTASPELIESGRYLAIAGDCTACHTKPGGKPFAGGLPLATPIGPIMATNITPSKTYGIGNYTLGQFAAALRRGVRGDGAHLYPAMPYTAYAQMSDDDTRALYAYFMNGVEPVDEPSPPTDLPFPFNIRLMMAGWNLLFLDSGPFKPDPAKSAEWNRGAYLAQGLTHCGTCHTPRNMMMAEETSRQMAGADLGDWYAPNITSDVNSGIGGWSEQEIVDYLRLGHTADKAQAAGPMAEAVDHSLRYMADADLRAIAVYLKTVPAVADSGETKPPYAWGSAENDVSAIRGQAVPTDPNQMSGPQLYDAYCATCHQSAAQGSPGGGLPPLFHNTTLGRTNTSNLVMAILQGVQRQPDAPAMLMPGFADDLSDKQVATLAGYLVQRYGNPSAKVSVEQVAQLRAGTPPSNLIQIARVGMIAGAVVLIIVVVLIVWYLRRRPVRPA
jgi:mono/diheme cytochrome c family protein